MGRVRWSPKLVAVTTIVNRLYSPELQVLGEETFSMIETDFTLEIQLRPETQLIVEHTKHCTGR